jgi:hypothetical protein
VDQIIPVASKRSQRSILALLGWEWRSAGESGAWYFNGAIGPDTSEAANSPTSATITSIAPCSLGIRVSTHFRSQRVNTESKAAPIPRPSWPPPRQTPIAVITQRVAAMLTLRSGFSGEPHKSPRDPVQIISARQGTITFKRRCVRFREGLTNAPRGDQETRGARCRG